MDFGWTEEEQMWRKAVRDFAQKKIAPRRARSTARTTSPTTSSRGWPTWGCGRPPSPRSTAARA